MDQMLRELSAGARVGAATALGRAAVALTHEDDAVGARLLHEVLFECHHRLQLLVLAHMKIDE